MIAAVLLAGGEAQRLGQPKGLVMLRGQRLLTHQLDALAAAGVGEVALSLGANRARYVEIWPELAQDAVSMMTPHGAVQLDVVADARSRLGPFGSLVAGIEALVRKEWQRLLVAPLDVIIVPRVVAALSAVSAKAVVPRYCDRGGHPVLLRHDLAASLSHLDAGESRLDVVLRGLPAGERQDVPVDAPEVVTNLNTPEAVQRANV